MNICAGCMSPTTCQHKNRCMRNMPTPSHGGLGRQVGGGHYKDMAIQPVEFIHKNQIPYLEGNVIKYLCRWRSKNGIEDLRKAAHYIELLITLELEEGDGRAEQAQVSD